MSSTVESKDLHAHKDTSNYNLSKERNSLDQENEMSITCTEGIDEVGDIETNEEMPMDGDSYLALISKSYQNVVTVYHLWAESLHKKRSCTSSALFHRSVSTIFIIVAMLVMGCALYATVSKLIAQGALLHYRIIFGGVLDADFLDQAFASASKEEQMAYVLSLWYNNLFIECFALWTFAIVRSTNAKAIPLKFKLCTYFSCIPLVVGFQWVADTSALYMYLDYTTHGFLMHAKLSILFWHIFQIASWVMQGLCLLAILGSVLRQLTYVCHTNQDHQ